MKIIGPAGELDIRLRSRDQLAREGDKQRLVRNGVDHGAYWVARDGAAVWVSKHGLTVRFETPSVEGELADKVARAPMTGRVVAIPVEAGSDVTRGDVVVILEAMKMEYRLEAQTDGVVAEVGVAVGDLVDLGQTLIRLR